MSGLVELVSRVDACFWLLRVCKKILVGGRRWVLGDMGKIPRDVLRMVYSVYECSSPKVCICEFSVAMKTVHLQTCLTVELTIPPSVFLRLYEKCTVHGSELSE